MARSRESWHHLRMAAGAVVIPLLFGTQAALARRGDAADGGAPAPWVAHLRRVDKALAQNNVSAALRAWHDADVATLGSRRWEGLVEVGDASLRIGVVSGFRTASEAKAWENYLAAVFRARRLRLGRGRPGAEAGVCLTPAAFQRPPRAAATPRLRSTLTALRRAHRVARNHG